MKKSYSMACHLILCAAAVSLMLAGCVKLPQGAGSTALPSQSSDPQSTFQVSFHVAGNVYSRQDVLPNGAPAPVTPQVPGLIFAGWQDSAGQLTDPQSVPVLADTDYYAVVYPELSIHGTYLFPDTHGFINPADPLTAVDLKAALEALATPEAKMYFPGLSQSGQSISSTVLRTVLSLFFPEEAVGSAMANLPEGIVSRSSFAGVMFTLLERDPQEKVTLANDVSIPKDVNVLQENMVALLDASVPHTPNSTGTTWQALMAQTYEPGFLNLDGWLYYVQEDGSFLRDGDLGDLHFGPDGRYTSGDLELDAQVAEVLAALITQTLTENPNASRLDILYTAHIYCRDHFDYLKRNLYEVGETGWEIQEAKTIFTTNLGNCYNYAAGFWALARGLGYEAYALSGTVTSTYQKHGWVSITLDGKEYFFDCEWEMVYRERQNTFDKNMFMIPIEKVSYWKYIWKK